MIDMNARPPRRRALKERFVQAGALCLLLGLGGLALAGPYGLLSWGENLALLEQRERQIATLEEQRDEYENLVKLLDPDNVDPDLATELARKNLNVAHPDEYIIELKAD